MIFIISGSKLLCLTVLHCNMGRFCLSRNHISSFSLQWCSWTASGFKAITLLDPWAAGVALNRNFWADSLWLFSFFFPPLSTLLLVSLHHHLPARGYFYLCIYFFPLKLQYLEVATGRTQSHMLCLTYINSVLGDSLSWPICSCQGIHYFSGPWGEKVLEHHYS